MSITRHNLAKVLGERTFHVHDTKLLAQEIAAYLLTENRTTDFDSLMRDVIQFRSEHGILEATVSSAYELSASVKSELKQLLKDEYPNTKHLTLHEKIDPELVGGLKLEMPGEQLDLSLRSKLAKFKRLTSEGIL